MKFDDNKYLVNTQLQKLGIDNTFFAYRYFLSYTQGLVSRFSSNYELPDYFLCFHEIENKIAPSVEHALRGRLGTHALAALLLARAEESTPFIDVIKLLVLNAVLQQKVAYDSPSIHFLRTFLQKSWDHLSEIKSETNYDNCFDHLKKNLDAIFDKQEIKYFINRLLDIYFTTPFKEKKNSEKNRSKRDEQIHRTRYTNTSIMTDAESKELAKILEFNLSNEKAPIAAVLVTSRVFSISIDEAYDLLASNFERIQSTGSINKLLQNPKSLGNKTVYETTDDNVNITLPSVLVEFLCKKGEFFERPSDVSVMSFIEKLNRKNKSLERINLSLIKGSSIQEFNLRHKNPILSYVIFGGDEESHPLEAHYNYVDELDLALYEEHLRKCYFEIETKQPSGFVYGCMLKDEVVDEFYKKLHGDMESESADIFINFNKRVIYRLHAIYLATGARPTIDPFSEWKDISLQYKILKITDKQVESSPFRYIPFPERIEEYIEQHKRDIKKLAAAIYRKDKNRKEISKAILDLSEGKNSTKLPLFFLIDENLKVVSVKGKDLIKGYNTNLPANFPRKIFASYMSRAIGMRTSQALLGHTYTYIPYLGQLSLNSQNNAQQIRSASKALLDLYGFEALPELQGYCSTDLLEINKRISRHPKLEDKEIFKILRADSVRKSEIRGRDRLVADLVKKYRKGEISEGDIENLAKEKGRDAKEILQRVKNRIARIKHTRNQHDFYRGGQTLIVRSEKLIDIYEVFWRLLDDIEMYSNVELSNYFRLSLCINRRLTSKKIVDAIVKALNRGDFNGRKVYVELYGRHQSFFVLDKISYFIALKIVKSGRSIKNLDKQFDEFIFKHIGVREKKLKEVVSAVNDIQFDSLHADFLSGKSKNATLATKLINSERPEIEKIKVTTKRKALPGQLAAVIRKSNKVKIEMLRDRLETLLKQSNLTESDEIIAKWGIKLVERNLDNLTVIKYMRIVNNIISQSEISEFLTIGFLNRQEGLIKHFKKINLIKDADYDFKRFIDFYENLSCLYDLYVDIDEIAEEVDARGVSINNLIIQESDYFILIYLIANDVTLTAIFILFYRFGCRTREVAYLLVTDFLRDGNCYILNIKKNEYRDLKTDNSRRLAYQLENLIETEKTALERFVSERSLSTSTNLLFAFENGSEVEVLINKANSILQAAFQTQYISLYSFRHSYCSRVTESIYRKNYSSLTHHLTALSDLQAQYVFLSQNLGHASIRTTFENYDHFSQVIFYRKIDELIDKELSKLSFKKLELLTGISSVALRKKNERNKDFIKRLAVVDEVIQSPLVLDQDKLSETLNRSENRNSVVTLKKLDRFLCSYIDELGLSAEIFYVSVTQLKDYLEYAQKLVTLTKLDPYGLTERLGNYKPINDLPKMARVIEDILTRAEKSPIEAQIISDALSHAKFMFRKIILPVRKASSFVESVSDLFQSDKLISCSRLNEFQFEIRFNTANHPDVSLHIIERVLFILMMRSEVRGKHDQV